MKQFSQVYKSIVSVNASMFFSYRANLFGSLLATSSWTILVIITMLIAVDRAKSVAGWEQPELLLLTGTMLILLGLFELHFKRSFQRLSDTIFQGDLDLLLLKPVDSQFLVTFIHMNFMSILRLVTGIGFVVYIIVYYQLPISFASAVGYGMLLFIGLICYYSIWMMICTILIWSPRLSNLVEVINSMNHTTRFPPAMYQEFNTYLFLFLLPYMFIVATPLHALLGEAQMIDYIGLFGSAIVLFTASRMFWKYALRYYTSASS